MIRQHLKLTEIKTFIFSLQRMVYDNRGYEDDEFVNGSKAVVNGVKHASEFAQNPKNTTVISIYLRSQRNHLRDFDHPC